MNKKEIFEIRKQMSVLRQNIVRICDCYVNADKEIQMMSKKAFLSLPEETMCEYLDIFKKSVSGNIGKNLLSLSYETKTDMPEQAFLLELKESQLSDMSKNEDFFKKVIDSYDYDGSYYIVLAYGVYDIPGAHGDDSTDVYEYLICTICPMQLSKSALSYASESNSIEDRTRDLVIEMPMHAFLYPAFTDRAANVHEALLYTKKTGKLPKRWIQDVLGTKVPLSFDDQKKAFCEILPETTSLADYLAIQDEINTLQDDEAVEVVDTDTAKNILESVGLPSDVPLPEAIPISTLSGNKKISMEGIQITADADVSLDIKEVDGCKYLMIPVHTSVDVNGVIVRP